MIPKLCIKITSCIEEIACVNRDKALMIWLELTIGDHLGSTTFPILLILLFLVGLDEIK